MKTRKQQTLQKKRAEHRPTKRSAAPGRPAASTKAVKRTEAVQRAKTLRRAKAASGRSPRRPSGDGSLRLAAECTVAEADSLKSELARRLDEAEPVTVDVSALQRIDTAALQLLAAFVRDRRTAGRAVAWQGRAAALETAAGLLGLNDMLELPGEVGR